MDFWENIADAKRRRAAVQINIHRPTPDINMPPENPRDTKASNENTVKPKEVKDTADLHNTHDTLPDLVDVAIITAVEDEYLAAKKVFKNVFSERFENGFKYSLSNYEVSQGKTITIAIFRQTYMGLVSAAMTAAYAIYKFNPKLMLMCGVCAGVEGKCNLGDLIVFSPVYDYGSGKYTHGQFLPDYRHRQIGAEIRPLVERMCADTQLAREIKDSWDFHPGKPDTELRIHICPGGSGAAVITDEAVIASLKTHQRSLGAIDMESFSIAEVASAATTREIPWLVVKGVQDFATPLKNDTYRQYAAFVSALFLQKFLALYFDIQ